MGRTVRKDIGLQTSSEDCYWACGCDILRRKADCSRYVRQQPEMPGLRRWQGVWQCATDNERWWYINLEKIATFCHIEFLLEVVFLSLALIATSFYIFQIWCTANISNISNPCSDIKFYYGRPMATILMAVTCQILTPIFKILSLLDWAINLQ